MGNDQTKSNKAGTKAPPPKSPQPQPSRPKPRRKGKRKSKGKGRNTAKKKPGGQTPLAKKVRRARNVSRSSHGQNTAPEQKAAAQRLLHSPASTKYAFPTRVLGDLCEVVQINSVSAAKVPSWLPSTPDLVFAMCAETPSLESSARPYLSRGGFYSGNSMIGAMRLTSWLALRAKTTDEAPSGLCTAEYLHEFLSATVEETRCAAVAVERRWNGDCAVLDAEFLKQMPIPVPPPEKQREILARLAMQRRGEPAGPPAGRAPPRRQAPSADRVSAQRQPARERHRMTA